MSLVPSSCSSSTTVLTSCGRGLGGLASLWLSVTFLGEAAVELGLWVWREVSGLRSRSVDLTLFQDELITNYVEDLLEVQF